jgi:hypothetical protein
VNLNEAHIKFYDLKKELKRELFLAVCKGEYDLFWSMRKNVIEADDNLEDIVFPLQYTKCKDMDAAISVKKTCWDKCARCWKHLFDVGINFYWPDICERCANACQGLFDDNVLPPEAWSSKLEERPKCLE